MMNVNTFRLGTLCTLLACILLVGNANASGWQWRDDTARSMARHAQATANTAETKADAAYEHSIYTAQDMYQRTGDNEYEIYRNRTGEAHDRIARKKAQKAIRRTKQAKKQIHSLRLQIQQSESRNRNKLQRVRKRSNKALRRANEARDIANDSQRSVTTLQTTVDTFRDAITSTRHQSASNSKAISTLKTELARERARIDTAYSGIASALAIASLPSHSGEGTSLSLGAGSFEGHNATAIGLTRRKGRFTIKAGIDTSNSGTYSIGMSYQFD